MDDVHPKKIETRRLFMAIQNFFKSAIFGILATTAFVMNAHAFPVGNQGDADIAQFIAPSGVVCLGPGLKQSSTEKLNQRLNEDNNYVLIQIVSTDSRQIATLVKKPVSVSAPAVMGVSTLCVTVTSLVK
jgi:hypothetical protein